MPKLTDAAIRNKRPNPIKRVEIHDGGGLYLVIQPTGSKSWAFRYRAAGKSRKLSLGPYGEHPAIGVAKARALASAELVRVRAGGDPARDRRRETADTFKSVARRFVERYAQPKNRSWKETARLLGLIPDPEKVEKDDPASFVVRKNSAVDKWGARKVSDIRQSDVITLLDDVVDGGAPVGANRVFSAVRKLFNWADSRYALDSNPCAKVQKPSEESSRDRVLSDDELRLVWNAAKKSGWPFGPIVQLLILTGQRRDEVAGMAWSEVNGKTWKLPRGRVKNDTGHEVPLSPMALDIIKSVPKVEGVDLLFTTTGKTPVSGFSKEKAALEEAVGFDDWWLHDLRRTMASGMARLGISLPVIEKVLNHSSGSFRGIVGVYQRHEYAEEKRHALNAWAAHVARIVSGKPRNVVALRG